MNKTKNNYLKETLYIILRPLLYFYISLYKPKVVNAEYIPTKGKIILAGNHTNYLDCLLLGSTTKRCVHFLAKYELTKGVKGFVFRNFGIIPVNRSIKDKNSLENAIDTLNHDKVIGIFPEGTINKTNNIIMPFKYGTIKMAFETKSLIIPFAINGKYKLLKKSVSIKFGKPYKIESNNMEKENNKLMNKVQELILEGKNGK